jgi:hypothetical protein
MGPLRVLAAISAAAVAAAGTSPSLDLLDSLGQNMGDDSGNAPPAALMLMDLGAPAPATPASSVPSPVSPDAPAAQP